MKVILTTARLRLREMAATDLDFIAATLANPHVMEFYPSVLTRSQAADWLQRQYERYTVQGHGLWLVENLHTGEPIGLVGLVMQQVGDEALPEIGYLIDAPYWRQGFAREATQAVRDYAFDVCKYPLVISLVRPINLPSQAVARGLGMRIQRTVMFKGYKHLVFVCQQSER